jgi:hypothetical protein
MAVSLIPLANAVSGTLPDGNAPSGSVLQVVYSQISLQVNTTSTTGVDTGLTATITPSSSTSKILILVSQQVYISGDNGAGIEILRGLTPIYNAGNYIVFAQTAGVTMAATSQSFLDSPNTTSATTYKTQIRSRDSGEAVGVNRDDSNTSSMVLMEIAA